MSGIIIKLKSIYKSLSDSEKKVATYILQNEDKVPFQSIYKIADSANVSVPSVIRVIKKIGYKSFKVFKIELAKDFSSSVVDIYSSIVPEDNDEELIKKVFLGNIKSLENTLKVLEKDALISVSKKICNSKRIRKIWFIA